MRYYWPQPEADAAVARLFEVLEDKELPETLIGQYLGARYESVRKGRLTPTARSLAMAAVESLMEDYISACER
jgi:tagatose-1,6-bisphosphate aldolase non-catalytic subunit AgaZ/GatZ